MLRNKSLSDKVLVVGIDGLDPRYSKKLVDAGKMPNLKKLIDAGAQREDLVLLGGCVPVTPPGWTTLSTGAYSYNHGITQFFAKDATNIEQDGYNIHSRMPLAEPIWNATAEAGLKTCVFHWPGGAWPPTSDNENLFVIDGTTPGSPFMAPYRVDGDFFFGADPTITEAEFIPEQEGYSDAPCVIKELPVDKEAVMGSDVSGVGKDGFKKQKVYLDQKQGMGVKSGRYQQTFNYGKSYLRPAQGWADAPEGAMEFMVLFNHGLIHRYGLVLKNAEGKYDKVALYKTKKDVEPMVVLKAKEYYRDFVDEGFQGDRKCQCTRDIYVFDIAEDGQNVHIYFSTCVAIDMDTHVHPKWLHEELLANAGPYPPALQFYEQDDELMELMIKGWDHIGDWYDKAIHYLIEKHGMQVILSHWHACDFIAHTCIRYLKDHGWNKVSEDHVEGWMDDIYALCDKYIGHFVHLIDEGWTVIVTSDHALVGPAHEPPGCGDMSGINVQLMEELGYTVVKTDENGKKLHEIDWEKTTAIQEQGGNIWINLKSRWDKGIVADEDQYELEEQIMTDLYSYKHPETGKRCIGVALRRKDAVFFGYGGPQSGDIFIANAEGYNYDHTDGLCTSYGERGTSLSPIFVAAGKGLKKGYTTNRVIRQVDLAPTICVLTGARIPESCDGAPIYCILEEEL